jgi:hypothetical protein
MVISYIKSILKRLFEDKNKKFSIHKIAVLQNKSKYIEKRLNADLSFKFNAPAYG